MSRYSKQKKASEQTRSEAMAIARGTQKPGQTKEQTKLIAQGIEKGIELYKKQQKAKARELDKRLKNAKSTAGLPEQTETASTETAAPVSTPTSRLPWLLLGTSWALFALYLVLTG